MRDIKESNTFKKDMKKVSQYKEFKPKLLRQYAEMIARGEPLPPKAKDHAMVKTSPKWYQGMRDFHVAADIAVIYTLTDDTVYLERIGKHNNLGLTEKLNLKKL